MRRIVIFSVLGVLLVTAVWWMFLISPRNARISELDTETNVAIDTEQRLRVQVRQLQEIRDREVEYIAAVGKLDALIPTRPLLEEFIEQIYALAGSTGVRLQSLAPSIPAAVDAGTDLRQISVSVQIEGQFFEILGFLFGLSDMERLVRVDGISLSSTEDETGATILGVSLELRLFTLADLLPVDLELLPGTPTTSTTVVEGGPQANEGGSAAAEGGGG